jgi:hypothetical protein
MQLGVEPDELDFTFSACSGAVIDQINDQAKWLSEEQQFITISAVSNKGTNLAHLAANMSSREATMRTLLQSLISASTSSGQKLNGVVLSGTTQRFVTSNSRNPSL